MFGNSGNTGGGMFGARAASTGGLFGQSAPQQQSAPGGLFGQSNTQQQPQQSAAGGLFGQNSAQQPATGGLFGQNNTQQPASGGLFGQNSAQQPATGGLFGQSNTQQPASGGLFGQNNTQQQQPATGGLFGAKPAAPSGGLFGSSQPAAPATTGGLFGGSQPATNSGGLFGAKPAAPSGGLFGSGQPAAPSGGLFGAKPAAPSGGLFGSSQPATTSGGLFGAKPAGTTGGLFGSSQPATTSGGLFGAKPAAPSGGLFGSSQPAAPSGGLFGGAFGSQQQQQQPQQYQEQQQQQQALSYLPLIQQLGVTPMTRLSELPPALKQELELLNKYIEQQVSMSYQLKANMDSHLELIESIPRDIDFLNKIYYTTNEGLEKDLIRANDLRNQTTTAVEDSELVKIIIQQIMDSPNSKISYKELEDYFNKKMHHYKRKLSLYMTTLNDIEVVIKGLEEKMFGESYVSGGVTSGAMNNSASPSSSGMNHGGLVSIMNALMSEFELFMKTAERIAELHQKVKEVVTSQHKRN